MNRLPIVALASFAASAAAEQTRADDRQIAYGKHLAAECSGCHRLDGTASNIPAIIGRPAPDIVAAIKEFQDGKRTNPAMASVAQSLDDGQISALAAYLATLGQHKR